MPLHYDITIFKMITMATIIVMMVIKKKNIYIYILPALHYFEARKIYCYCKSCNHARVTTAEVENLQETMRLYPGFWLVNGDPIRPSVIWP